MRARNLGSSSTPVEAAKCYPRCVEASSTRFPALAHLRSNLTETSAMVAPAQAGPGGIEVVSGAWFHALDHAKGPFNPCGALWKLILRASHQGAWP